MTQENKEVSAIKNDTTTSAPEVKNEGSVPTDAKPAEPVVAPEKKKVEKPVKKVEAKPKHSVSDLSEKRIVSVYDDFLQAVFATKIFKSEEFAFILKNENVSEIKTITEFLEIIHRYDEVKRTSFSREIVEKVFGEAWGHKIEVGTATELPFSIKETFQTELPKFKKEDWNAIIAMGVIPFDIKWETLTILTWSPEVHREFVKRIMPLLRLKRLRSIEVIICDKKTFEFYKTDLTHIEASNEI